MSDQWGWVLLFAGVAIGAVVYLALSRGGSSAPLYKPVSHQPVYLNEEVWRWTDWRGRNREIVIHREVKMGV